MVQHYMNLGPKQLKISRINTTRRAGSKSHNSNAVAIPSVPRLAAFSISTLLSSLQHLLFCNPHSIFTSFPYVRSLYSSTATRIVLKTMCNYDCFFKPRQNLTSTVNLNAKYDFDNPVVIRIYFRSTRGRQFQAVCLTNF